MTKKITIKIVSKKGKCTLNHEIGDEIIISEKGINGDICIHALYSMLPKVFAFMYGADFPWLKDKNSAKHACPDPVNSVVFEIVRE